MYVRSEQPGQVHCVVDDMVRPRTSMRIRAHNRMFYDFDRGIILCLNNKPPPVSVYLNNIHYRNDTRLLIRLG